MVSTFFFFLLCSATCGGVRERGEMVVCTSMVVVRDGWDVVQMVVATGDAAEGEGGSLRYGRRDGGVCSVVQAMAVALSASVGGLPREAGEGRGRGRSGVCRPACQEEGGRRKEGVVPGEALLAS